MRLYIDSEVQEIRERNIISDKETFDNVTNDIRLEQEKSAALCIYHQSNNFPSFRTISDLLSQFIGVPTTVLHAESLPGFHLFVTSQFHHTDVNNNIIKHDQPSFQ